MKKTISSKNKNRTKTRNRQNPEIDMGAAKILKTVTDQEAFYFHEAVGKPTGQIARSLSDFLEKAKSVKPESLMFHLQRRDFQSWIEKILGDSKLARKLEEISISNGDDVKMSICRTVENRIKELRDSSKTILVGETPAALLSSSQ
jgi:hypothetical protein